MLVAYLFFALFLYVSLACPSWTTSFNNKCYWFSDSISNTAPYSWYDAEARCNCLSGHLASIENAIENKFILNHFNSLKNDPYIWIGGLAVKGSWDVQKMGYDWSEWRWSNNKSMRYVNWDAGEPRYNSCVYIQQDKWHTDTIGAGAVDYMCSSNFTNFVCEIPQKGLKCPKAQLINATDGEMPIQYTAYWTYFEQTNVCYQVPGDLYTFSGLANQCNNKTLSLHSPQDTELLRTYMWLNGLSDNGGNMAPFVGLVKKDGKWTWYDGTQLTYTNWLKDSGEFACASFDESLRWYDEDCGLMLEGICQMPGSVQTDQSLPTVCFANDYVIPKMARKIVHKKH